MGDTWISFGELREIVGEDAAGRLCAIYGGVSFYVPKAPNEASRLQKIIGFHALASLARVYGGDTVIVPNRRKEEPSKTRILEMLEKGISAREIALTLNVTQRYVNYIARNFLPKNRQANLPGISF